MPDAELIVRERELEELLAALEEAAAGRGSVVFLSGHTGSGRSTLLRVLEERAAGRPSLERVEVVRTTCYEIDVENPLAPFLEILRGLVTEDRRWTKAKRTLELVRDVAPPLLTLIPGIGALAAVGTKAAAEGGIWAIGDRDTQSPTTHANVALALRAVAKESPLALLIDDAQWMDKPSANVVERLARMRDAPLALVVALDAALAPDNELAQVRKRVAADTRSIRLEDLDTTAIERTLAARYGGLPHPRLAEWLHDHTDGTPYFLLQYLTTLEEGRVLLRDDGGWAFHGSIEGGPGHWRLAGAIADVPTPSDMLGILEPQVDALAPEEVALLRSGAIQGKHFLGRVVARMVARDETEVNALLQDVHLSRRLITPQEALDWWTERTARYTFEPGPVREVLYERYAKGAFQRKEQHRAVADALEELLGDEETPPRHALLEIARHRELALELLPAARLLVDVGASAYEEGADREAAALAAHALELLDRGGIEKLAGDGRRDATTLLARALLLVLLAGEVAWRGDWAAGVASPAELAERAEAAAAESGDPRLQANARFASGRVRLAHEGLDPALAAFEEALTLAREAGDPLAELAVLVNLGHHRVSKSLREGRDVLRQAQELLAGGALAGVLDESRLAIETARVDSRVGVAELDLGNYGEALRLLTRASAELEEARQRYDAALALAFLAQAQTAIGLFEEGRATLERGIAIFAEDRGDLGARGYLRALLGRLLVEWGPPRLEEARRELERARAETLAAQYRPVVPLVQTHWAELLVAEGTEESLAEADEVLAATKRQAAEVGWARSEIAADSLRARIALARGSGEALELSTAAVERLALLGGAVPTVRSEEILYVHHLALAAAGSPDAREPLVRAAQIVRDKADSLDDPAQRESFLTRVRLSREILAAADGAG
jgi:hypothetical protein